MSKRDVICKKLIEWGILGLIVLSPLPKASVHEWSILVIQLVVFGMMIAYFLMREKPEGEIRLKESLRWPRYLFTGLFVLIFIQLLPWPKFLLNLVSPNSVNFREVYAIDFSGIKFMGLSLIPSHTLQGGLELLAYVLLGFLVVKTVTQKKQILRIVYSVVGMGIFQAFYGLFELYNKNPRLLFYKKIHYLGDVTGTFVNRNHLSGYLEMVIPLTIGLILVRSDVFAVVGMSWRSKILSLFEKSNYRNLLLALGVILMAVAVVFSRSRSGIFLLVFTFVLLLGMGTMYTGKRRHYQKGIKRFVQVVFLMIVVLCLFVGIDATVERFALDNILKEVRPLMWGNTAAIIGDYPVFGSGLGTFAAVYPAYEENVMAGRVSHAHNDYLEYFAELGVVGGLLLLAGILFMLVVSFLVWKERRHPKVKGLALGGIIAVVNILIHSVTDFNLHIPANMILFAVILPLTLVLVFYRMGKGDPDSGFQDREEKSFSLGLVKKTAGYAAIGVLVLAMAVSVIFYWGQHLVYKSQRVEEPAQKITLLEKLDSDYAFNDRLFYELGRAYFLRGLQSSGDSSRMVLDLKKAGQSLTRSLEINPGSALSHFCHAQVLMYLSYLTPSEELNYFDAYRRAASLAGHNRDILRETAKVFFSQWAILSDEDKDFTRKILRKIAKVGQREDFEGLMFVWEKTVKDFSVIEEALPEDVYLYRIYARFLGEKSLSRLERLKALASAESWEFTRAEEEYKEGDRAFMYLRVREASRHFETCLSILNRIFFYQDLVNIESIDKALFLDIRKNACLKLFKCRLREGQALNDLEGLLRLYLELEDRATAVNELHDYMVSKGLVNELGADLDDLKQLAFLMTLYFKQNQYQEIIRVGERLKQSFVVVPDEMKEAYVEVLQLIGRSYQNVDSVYEAEDFYRMAFERDPINLDTLLFMRSNYERLNNSNEIRRIDGRIKELTRSDLNTIDRVILKRQRYTGASTLEGGKRNFKLFFEVEEDKPLPLVSIFLNGRVVWEDYLKEGVVSIPVEVRTGKNSVMIVPVNRAVRLKGMEWEKRP